ncbi:MAG: aminotransferase class III-fold pyridoxal phosphate-dependent enzyme, partial [Acidobacteriota bacterium]|nr:aminotransferase class III-fold pyridoxal phosphate-dependent enzyme [Acidobacteriota bacterium]
MRVLTCTQGTPDNRAAVPSRDNPALFPRSFQRTFPVAVRGEGVHLWDAEGKRYLDFSGSAAVNFIGHSVAEIARAMAEQAAKLEFVHSSQFVTPVAEEFARELLQFAGAGFRGGAVYFTSGGSEAVETALKLARQYQVEIGEQKRFRILSRKQSYHGATLGALAVSGNVMRREMYLPMVREFEQAVPPNCYRCPYACQDCGAKYAGDVERLLKEASGEAAGFILEPVSGATLGAAVPPPGYLEKVAAACARHGALLIADEVMTGCGRTGRNFAVEHWSVAPDLLVTGKGIASGYAPLGAVIANKKVVDAISQGSGSFVHGFTYNAHPVAVAAGRAVLERMKAGKLVAAASSTGAEDSAGAVLATELDNLEECRAVGDVRGLGMLRGVEFVADKATKQPFPPEQKFA